METELQFDQVNRPATVRCGACESALSGSYFQANGHMLCESCAATTRGDIRDGNGFLRFMKATGLGVAGAACGGAVYTTVLAITHINAALVTILIGWLVGRGVHNGSGGRGGRGYQILAVAITYLAIGFSATLASVLTTDTAHGSVISGIVICIIGTFVGSVLMAMTGILGAVITFFGLLQAWKQNRATGMEVTGPHALATEPEPEPAVTEARPPLPQGAPALP